MSETRSEMQRDGQENQDSEESLPALSLSMTQRNYAQRFQRFLSRGVSPLVAARRSDETGTGKDDAQSQLQSVSEFEPSQEALKEKFGSSQDSNSVFTDSQSQINVSGTPIERQLALRSYQSAVAMARLKNPQIKSLSPSMYPSCSKTPVVGNDVCSPFDPNVIDNVCQAMNSPSLFAFKKSVASNNLTFQWSPEQLAKIQPAKLDEDGTSEKENCFSPKKEKEIQAAIDSFFDSGLVHPSPQLGTSANPLSFTSVSESPVAKCTAKKRVKTKNAICQTLFTFPPKFDMDFFLGKSRFRLSDITVNNQEGAFRRKLFTLHHQQDDKLPIDPQFYNSSKSFEGTTSDRWSMRDMETALLPETDKATGRIPSKASTLSFLCDSIHSGALDLSSMQRLNNRNNLNDDAMDTSYNVHMENTPVNENDVGRCAFCGNGSEIVLDSNGRVNSSTLANAAGQKWPDSLSAVDESHGTLTANNEDKGHPRGSRSLDSGIASRNMTSHDDDM
ncbi:protein aurora borealis [Trichuris trichiura]|uniref:Protein aurora borealis n=1 Tax=Trichuris trichiura TaxID=36087 RepID=A0A077ZK59_TRITR|nr:protein aurora borealis [Trichuris trichiura]